VRSWPLVNAGAAATLNLSSQQHEIRSGQTRSWYLRLHFMLPSLDVASPCFKRMFQVFEVFHVDVAK
jgi:hypothetical protein